MTPSRRLLCSAVLPALALAPLPGRAFQLGTGEGDAAAAPAAGCASGGPIGTAEVASLREAHARHAAAAPVRKMMEEGAVCPICGCPPQILAAIPFKAAR
jgi:hypothetical protein